MAPRLNKRGKTCRTGSSFGAPRIFPPRFIVAPARGGNDGLVGVGGNVAGQSGFARHAFALTFYATLRVKLHRRAARSGLFRSAPYDPSLFSNSFFCLSPGAGSAQPALLSEAIRW